MTVPSTSTFPVLITATESETAYYSGAATYISSDNSSYTVQSNSNGYLKLATSTTDQPIKPLRSESVLSVRLSPGAGNPDTQN